VRRAATDPRIVQVVDAFRAWLRVEQLGTDFSNEATDTHTVVHDVACNIVETLVYSAILFDGFSQRDVVDVIVMMMCAMPDDWLDYWARWARDNKIKAAVCAAEFAAEAAREAGAA
jgi:hypothetical protein